MNHVKDVTLVPSQKTVNGGHVQKNGRMDPDVHDLRKMLAEQLSAN